MLSVDVHRLRCFLVNIVLAVSYDEAEVVAGSLPRPGFFSLLLAGLQRLSVEMILMVVDEAVCVCVWRGE